MKDLGNGFDGTLSKALETSKLASGKPKWLQDRRASVWAGTHRGQGRGCGTAGWRALP